VIKRYEFLLEPAVNGVTYPKYLKNIDEVPYLTVFGLDGAEKGGESDDLGRRERGKPGTCFR
jgi:hypothetical protein